MNQLALLNEPSQFPVNCREVHQKLESKRDYTSWIKTKLEKANFTLGTDYSPTLVKNKPGRGRKSHEYYCTYDMAKHLCLMENTEMGKEARKYFIHMEKVALGLIGSGKQAVDYSTMDPLEFYEMRAREIRAFRQREIEIVNDYTKQFKEVHSIQESDTLTHDQISELDDLINQKVKSTGDMKDYGRIKKAIKKASFKIAGTRTYKEIPRRDFDKAKQIVMEY